MPSRGSFTSVPLLELSIGCGCRFFRCPVDATPGGRQKASIFDRPCASKCVVRQPRSLLPTVVRLVRRTAKPRVDDREWSFFERSGCLSAPKVEYADRVSRFECVQACGCGRAVGDVADEGR